MAKQRNRIELLPLFFLLAISCGIPFVVYMHLVDYPAVIRNIYAQPNNMDFFTYNRVVWLYILTGSALFWFLINEKSKSCWYHRPLVAYSFFVVVSTIFSEFPQLAFFGDPAHHEGMLAHLCYMCIVFLFINLVKGKRELKIIVVGVLVSSALLAVIGIFQFFGYDYFYSDFPAKYLVPDSFKKLAPNFSMDVFKPRFVEIISTFGNGNCVGSYMTMLFSLSFVMLLGNFGRWRFCLIPLNLFLFFNLMACGSRAGMLGALVACVSAGIFSRHRLRSKALAMGLLSVSFVIVLLLMTNYTVSSGHSRLLASYLLKGSTYSKRSTGQFKSLELRGNEATVLFDDLPLRVRVRGKKAEFFDQDNTKAPFRLIPIPSAGANGLVGTGSCAAKSASSTSRMVKNDEGAQRRDSKSGKAPGAGIHGKRSSDAGPCYQVEFFRGKFP